MLLDAPILIFCVPAVVAVLILLSLRPEASSLATGVSLFLGSVVVIITYHCNDPTSTLIDPLGRKMHQRTENAMWGWIYRLEKKGKEK